MVDTDASLEYQMLSYSLLCYDGRGGPDCEEKFDIPMPSDLFYQAAALGTFLCSNATAAVGGHLNQTAYTPGSDVYTGWADSAASVGTIVIGAVWVMSLLSGAWFIMDMREKRLQ
jgi:hypothetical protein